MKTRAELARERKNQMLSAAERTSEIPGINGVREADPARDLVLCAACSETNAAGSFTPRADGLVECPSCGCAMKLPSSSAGASARPVNAETTVPITPEMIQNAGAPPRAVVPVPMPVPVSDSLFTMPSSPPPAFTTPSSPPPRSVTYCAECGSEWQVLSGKTYPNCGHAGARVPDPTLARRYAPPAGLRSGAEKEQPKAASNRFDEPAAGELLATPATNRLSVQWGESKIPYDQYNGYKVGGFIATVDIAEGEDRVEAARKILSDLEEIAEEAYRRQKAWYDKKLAPR